MHFKPRWLWYVGGSAVGLIAVKNVFAWDGDLTGILTLIAAAFGAGLRDLFSKEA